MGLNKGVKDLLRRKENLKKYFRRPATKTLVKENDIECGLGRKIIYLAKTNGVKYDFNYPFNFKGVVVKNEKDLEELVNSVIQSEYGSGYLAYLINKNEIVVLGATYRKKDSDCKLDIADYITLNDVSKASSNCINLKATSFYTEDGTASYTVSALDGANIAVLYYGENQILKESKYSLSGDTLTFTNTPGQRVKVVVLYTK